jgi:hypothetical protein
MDISLFRLSHRPWCGLHNFVTITNYEYKPPHYALFLQPPLRSKYSHYPESTFFLWCERPSFTPIIVHKQLSLCFNLMRHAQLTTKNTQLYKCSLRR